MLAMLLVAIIMLGTPTDSERHVEIVRTLEADDVGFISDLQLSDEQKILYVTGTTGSMHINLDDFSVVRVIKFAIPHARESGGHTAINLDQDVAPEYVKTSGKFHSPGVCIYDDDGTLVWQSEAESYYWHAFLDLDRDGIIEVAYRVGRHPIRVIRMGDPLPSPVDTAIMSTFSEATDLTSVVDRDIDGDGKPDVVSASDGKFVIVNHFGLLLCEQRLPISGEKPFVAQLRVGIDKVGTARFLVTYTLKSENWNKFHHISYELRKDAGGQNHCDEAPWTNSPESDGVEGIAVGHQPLAISLAGQPNRAPKVDGVHDRATVSVVDPRTGQVLFSDTIATAGRIMVDGDVLELPRANGAARWCVGWCSTVRFYSVD